MRAIGEPARFHFSSVALKCIHTSVPPSISGAAGPTARSARRLSVAEARDDVAAAVQHHLLRQLPADAMRAHDALGPAMALVGGLVGDRLARGGRGAAGAVGPEAEGVVGRAQRGLGLAAAHGAVDLAAEGHGGILGAVDGQPGQRPRRLAVARERVGHRRQQAGRGAQALAGVAREAHRHEAAVRRAHHEDGRRIAVILRDDLGDHGLEEAHVVDGRRRR
jgi:hypothetical protein